MMGSDQRAALLDLARRYEPRILFDAREPFLPRWIGVSRLDRPGPSPSARRELVPPAGGFVVEYAYYWDWDIQHAYDLEHVWVYVAADGSVSDAEASFHGRYLKSFVRYPGGRAAGGSEPLVLYSQPGKHAFSPLPDVFRLLPDCDAVTSEAAGEAGAEVPWPLRDRITHDPAWELPVRESLRRRAFEPAWAFVPWEAPPSIYVPWSELDSLLPSLFRGVLAAASAEAKAEASAAVSDP
ncbi:MAG: hypothetical protein Q8M76_07655 [Spirochaetaceae bacterium]|nr:hypothetical protein [Spirochaetaceae bacterium]